jgi:hypothetical protein
VATCRRCGVVDPDGADGAGLPLGWSVDVTERGVEPMCATCTRAHARDIEAKLGEEWWT